MCVDRFSTRFIRSILLRLVIGVLTSLSPAFVTAGTSSIDVANKSAPDTANRPVDVPADARELTVVIGHAQVLRHGPVARIAVGDGKVIQATALDNDEVLVLPEKVGQSTLHLWPRQGDMITYVVTVVRSDAARDLSMVRAMLGNAENLNARLVGESILIEGHSLSPAQARRIQVVQERFGDVVNMAGTQGAERMIAMDVRMIEIKKSAIKNLGIRWDSSARGPSFGVLADWHRSGAFQSPTLAEQAGVAARNPIKPFATTLSLASSVSSMLEFLVSSGDAVILAEPRLSCKSGGTARFVAGGELPIPHTAGLGAVSVSFKEYGVKFDFSPTAGADGLISAKIATEVSAIDFEVTVQQVPGLIKRRAETEVNLRENQTLVIAGLLTRDTTRHLDKVAGLGEVPVLGKLFRSRQYRSQQTDLVVFVTPRFVGESRDAVSFKFPGSTGPRMPDDSSSRLQVVE